MTKYKSLFARLLDKCEELNRALELNRTFFHRANRGTKEKTTILNNIVSESTAVSDCATTIANTAREELGE